MIERNAEESKPSIKKASTGIPQCVGQKKKKKIIFGEHRCASHKVLLLRSLVNSDAVGDN